MLAPTSSIGWRRATRRSRRPSASDPTSWLNVRSPLGETTRCTSQCAHSLRSSTTRTPSAAPEAPLMPTTTRVLHAAVLPPALPRVEAQPAPHLVDPRDDGGIHRQGHGPIPVRSPGRSWLSHRCRACRRARLSARRSRDSRSACRSIDHEVARRIEAGRDRPHHVGPVAHVDVLVDDDEQLGVGELRQQRPQPHHDAARLAGIALGDRDDRDPVGAGLRRQPEIHDLGELRGAPAGRKSTFRASPIRDGSSGGRPVKVET